MSTTRRVLIAVGAPLVLVVGLGLVWGWRNAAVLKAQIETWADSLEHSSNPVEMKLSFLPMYVEGENIGKLSAVVVQREAPGAVDSLRIVVSLSEDADVDHLAHCSFHLDPDAFDREGPMGFKEAVQCLEDTGDLVRFGTVAFAGTDRETGLYIEAHDLPCEHMSHSGEGSCREFREDIHRMREEIRNEVRGIRMNMRREHRKTTRVTVH
jgi:hypothetical protein